jgi:LEM domain
LDAVNVAALSDEELYEQLRIHGIPAGPIVGNNLLHTHLIILEEMRILI